MAKILERIHSSRGRAEAAEIGLTDRVYQAMMEDARDEIRSKAVSEARMGVQGELSAAQTAASTAKADTARTEAKLAQSEALVAKVEAKLQGSIAKAEQLEGQKRNLEKIVKLEQGTLTAKDLEYKNEIKQLKDDLRRSSSEKHDLELKAAKLEGRITAAPKAVKGRATKTPIPDFEISNLVRGHDGRIVSGKITVERPKK